MMVVRDCRTCHEVCAVAPFNALWTAFFIMFYDGASFLLSSIWVRFVDRYERRLVYNIEFTLYTVTVYCDDAI